MSIDVTLDLVIAYLFVSGIKRLRYSPMFRPQRDPQLTALRTQDTKSGHNSLLAFKVTSGNTDDRAPVKDLTKDIIGKCFGDKGYISKKLFESLFENGLQLVTSVKSNMKNKLMPMIDKILLRKRSLIETVNDQLKNVCQVEHTRHRSVLNFMVNMVAALVAYARQERKPCLNFDTLYLKNEGKSLSFS